DPLRRDDLLPLREEAARHLDGGLEEPSLVVPEVEDQPLHPAALEILESVIELGGGVLGESDELDVADARGGELVLEDGDADLGADDLELPGLGPALADELHLHLRPRLPLQALDDLVLAVAPRVPPVDSEDLVPRAEPRLRRRAGIDRADDREDVP